jgi:hypothetical protein
MNRCEVLKVYFVEVPKTKERIMRYHVSLTTFDECDCSPQTESFFCSIDRQTRGKMEKGKLYNVGFIHYPEYCGSPRVCRFDEIQESDWEDYVRQREEVIRNEFIRIKDECKKRGLV